MAKLLVGIYINQDYNNPDFTIELPDDVIEQIEYMYKRALEKSDMDEDTFGPTYYEQLKKEDKELADTLETAAYVKLESIIRTDSMSDCVQAMNRFHKQDRDGNYYQVFSISNKIDFDLTEFPRIVDK
ncbi:MAG: hypothetical protein J5965_15675 [Aeriscardovia sp.]|nr:hypothetical protein [Aeriscardovia sp.]